MVGALILVGLVVTGVAVRSWTPGRAWLPSTSMFVTPAPMAEPVRNDVVRPEVPAVQKPPTPDPVKRAEGPNAVISVPSAGLRTGPSLDSKALKTVVKQNDKVKILKRMRSDSGPDWVQIETASGRTGWVWASVVKEGKGKRRG